jgi:hypothetical protein
MSGMTRGCDLHIMFIALTWVSLARGPFCYFLARWLEMGKCQIGSRNRSLDFAKERLACYELLWHHAYVLAEEGFEVLLHTLVVTHSSRASGIDTSMQSLATTDSKQGMSFALPSESATCIYCNEVSPGQLGGALGWLFFSAASAPKKRQSSSSEDFWPIGKVAM